MSSYLFLLIVGGVFYCIFLSSQASEKKPASTSKSLLRKVFAWLLIFMGLAGIFFGFYLLLSGKIQGDSKPIRANRIANENRAILLKVFDNDNLRKEASVHAEFEVSYNRLRSKLEQGVMTEDSIDEPFDEYTRTGLFKLNDGSKCKIPVSEYFNNHYDLILKRGITLDEKIKFLAMYTSIAGKYSISCAVSWLDTKVRESISIDNKDLSVPYYTKIEDLTTNGKIELLESGYLSEKELKKKVETEEIIRAGYENMMTTCFILGFIVLGWGLYLKNFMKSSRPDWKKVGKVCVYILATFAYLVMDTMIGFTISVAILLLLIYGVKSAIESRREDNMEREVKKDVPIKGITAESTSNGSYKGLFIKLLGSVGLCLLFCALVVMILETRFGGDNDCVWLVIIYILYYLAIDVYYLNLIWRRRKVQGEDVLLLPFLNKLNIYKVSPDRYTQRKKLIQSILPILVISVLSPIVALIFDGYRSYGLAAFTLFLPFIAWIIFFIYAYSSTWLSSDKISLVISTEDEETKLNYGYRNEFSSPTMYYSKPLQGTGYISDLSNTEMLETTSYDGCTLDDFMPHSQKECASNFYIYLIYRNSNLDNPLALEIKRKYEEAAHDGIYEAYNNLGVLQQKLENYGESVRYFKKAIEKGSFYAYVNLATHYCVQKEWNNFFKYNELAMETNNPKAIFNQAIAHHFGLNTDKNITKALSLYRRLLNLQPNDIKYNMEVTQEDTDIFKYYRLLTRHNLALMFIAGEIGEEWLEEFPLIRCNLRYILNADRKAYAKKYGDLILHGRDCYELSNEALANEELQDMEYRLRKHYTSKNEY